MILGFRRGVGRGVGGGGSELIGEPHSFRC